MKKCPRCGAVLDDSKVKCYMCGTDLPRQNLTFGNTFNAAIGANVANGQGNVFGQNNQIQANPQGTGGNQSNQTMFSPNASNTSFYNQQLNNLNSMAYDERTAFEKMFSSDANFKSKAELNAQKAKKNKRNAFANAFSNSLAASQQQQQQQQQKQVQQPKNNMVPNQQQMQQQAKPKKPKKKLFEKKNKKQQNVQPVNNQVNKQVRPMMPNQPAQATNQQVQQNQQSKPTINWGNNLSNNQNYKKKEPINKALIFNVVALLISIAGALFVYFKFIKNKDGMKIRQLGQLTYTINNNFIVKDERSNYRLHTFGEYCSISITYGNTNTPNDYIDNFIEELKKKGDYGNKYKVLVSKFQDNTNNTWVETSLVYVSADAASELGYTQKTKIHYASIIFDGNFYTIVYQNDNDDTICSASYQSFIQSLAFK